MYTCNKQNEFYLNCVLQFSFILSSNSFSIVSIAFCLSFCTPYHTLWFGNKRKFLCIFSFICIFLGWFVRFFSSWYLKFHRSLFALCYLFTIVHFQESTNTAYMVNNEHELIVFTNWGILQVYKIGNIVWYTVNEK